MLLTKPMMIAAAALVAGLGALCVILWLRVATVQSDLDTCGKQRAELTGKVELQSQEVEDWKIAAEVAQEKADAATAKARQASQAGKARAEQLQAQILAGGGKECSAAVLELRRGWQ